MDNIILHRIGCSICLTLYASAYSLGVPIKIFEFSREKVGVIKTYGGSYFLDIDLLITADHLTGAFHAHLVDVLEQAGAGFFGEQAAQIFPVQPT